jgi:hypothetical protein
MANIQYGVEPSLHVDEFVDVLRRSTLAERRPVEDLPTMSGMLRHADVIVTARNTDGLLVGVSRAISDFSYCTYLSDLAVDVAFQCFITNPAGASRARRALRACRARLESKCVALFVSSPWWLGASLSCLRGHAAGL